MLPNPVAVGADYQVLAHDLPRDATFQVAVVDATETRSLPGASDDAGELALTLQSQAPGSGRVEVSSTGDAGRVEATCSFTVVAAAACGNGSCETGEDCEGCPADCACGPVCGDEQCSTGEDCESCSGDCCACGPVCGDGLCEGAERCSDCQADCGACPPVCGNGVCEAGEDCATCSADCVCAPSCAGWLTQDIGTPGLAGSATCSAGSFMVTAAGADIWYIADAFHYVYQPLTGDGAIQARVVSLQATHLWAKAGVMIRETLAADSRHAHVLVSASADNPVKFDRRLTTGGTTSGYTGTLTGAPFWVRLERQGDEFRGYESADGVSWTLVGTHVVPMAAQVFIGLSVTSHIDAELCEATFDSVRLGLGPPECVLDADCAGDGNPCTSAACVGGACQAYDNNAACDDGNDCTHGDICGAGACGGTAYVCFDGDPQTRDSCNGDGTCDFPTGPLPVFPGAQGFGTETIAGRGGRIIEVTNLQDGGAGSLRAALTATGPRVVVFRVSGTIRLASTLTINQPFVTVAGQTAPSPGITLRGATLHVATHDVLVQHLRVRVGDDPAGAAPGSRDGLLVAGSAASVYGVVLDHLSVSWALDEQFSAVYGAHDITLSNSFVTEALNASIHPEGPHSRGVLVREETHNLSLIRNLVAHNKENNPRVTAGTWVVAVNNVWYNGGQDRWFDVSLGTQGGTAPHLLTVEGNVFLRGLDTPTPAWPIWVDSTTLAGSKVYEHDSLAPGAAAMLRYDTPFDPQVLARPIWTPSIQPLPSIQTEAVVLARAGARPLDRDAVDLRVAADVAARQGRIIDSTAQVGGWPNLAVNVRPFQAPLRPDADDDGDGYTNIEELLHRMARALEAP